MLTLNALKVEDVEGLPILTNVQRVNLTSTHTPAVGPPRDAELCAVGPEAEALVLCRRTSSPYALPLKTFVHPPFFGRLTLGRAMRMTG